LPASPDNRDFFVATRMWGRGPRNVRVITKFELAANHHEFHRTLSLTRESILTDALMTPIRGGFHRVLLAYASRS